MRNSNQSCLDFMYRGSLGHRKPMRVLVACECSGRVRDAFRRNGHEAYSCDIKPSVDNSDYHIVSDVLSILNDSWDIMVAHPPCTHLCVSGARWFSRKQKEQADALDFVGKLMGAPIPKICIENPVSVISTYIRKPDQIIQPWMFGDPFQKTTCLWLKNLPKLLPTNIVDKGEMQILRSGKKIPKWYSNCGGDRATARSVTFQGIADAMANQWG